MKEGNKEIATKICCWWCTVRSDGNAKANVFYNGAKDGNQYLIHITKTSRH
jgi:hypothetical protein